VLRLSSGEERPFYCYIRNNANSHNGLLIDPSGVNECELAWQIESNSSCFNSTNENKLRKSKQAYKGMM
jgi:hypothetical protein